MEGEPKKDEYDLDPTIRMARGQLIAVINKIEDRMREIELDSETIEKYSIKLESILKELEGEI